MPRAHRAPLKKGSELKKCNILLAGGPKVGCSSLISRYLKDSYTESFVNNMDIDGKIKNFTIDSSNLKAQIWDKHTKYHGADTIILAFDLSDAQSFANLDNHLFAIQNGAKKNIPIVIVGTKSDIGNQVTSEQIEDYIEKKKPNGYNIAGYFEVSAAKDINVSAPFDLAVKAYLDNNYAANRKESIKDTKKKTLILALEKYISRIESHKMKNSNDINFHHGFSLFANSRASNRKANYLLAKSLLNDLCNRPDCSIKEIFDNIAEHRQDIIGTESIWEMLDFVNRGINSKELNSIIAQATEHSSFTKNSK